MKGYKEIKDHQRVLKGAMFDFYQDTIVMENDKIYKRDYVVHPGAVAIVPFIDSSSIILERNYRYPFDRFCIEIPAGKLEKDEDPYNAALRELEEETGYHAQKITPLGRMLPVSAYSTEIIHFFVATDLVKTQTHLDEDEVLETFIVPFEEALRMIDQGEIDDAKTIALLLKIKRMLDQGHSW